MTSISNENSIMQPGDYDVICGCNKASGLNMGNMYLRKVVQQYVDVYMEAPKNDKTRLISKVQAEIRLKDGLFIIKDILRRNYFEVSNHDAVSVD